MDLRPIFFKEMKKMASEDENVILLVGDLGYSFMEEFAREYPKQFLNVGIAEQNMVGIAAGMAKKGKKPYVYSGSTLLLSRAYEQIRDDVCFNNTNVKLVGTGAADFLGFTHNWQEGENELNLLMYLPNIDLYQPTDKDMLIHSLHDSYVSRSAAFIRL